MSGREPKSEEGEAKSALGAARALMEKEKFGTLCTAHAEHDGWPFGSLTPYALLPSGDPVVFLSDLAEHTHNLEADPRASLFVVDRDAQDHPQAGARVTVMAQAKVASPTEKKAAEEAYFGKFPSSRAMTSAHAFAFYVLHVEHVRWIAGFGSMGWISKGEWAAGGRADPLAAHAAGIIDHLNADHAPALLEMAAYVGKVKGRAARATALDASGFDLEVTGAPSKDRLTVRIPFPERLSTPGEVRKAVMALLGEARRAKA